MIRFLTTNDRPVVGLLALALLLFCSGCAGASTSSDDTTRWLNDYRQALVADDADQALAEVADRAPSNEKARDVQFDRARLALRAGDHQVARQRFQALWDARQDDAVASRALYELARLSLEADGDRDGALALAQQAIVATVPWAGSELALKFYVNTRGDQGEYEAAVRDLGQMADDVDNPRMAAQLHLQRGLFLDDPLGRADEALAAYRAAQTDCDDCAAADEALFQMGRIYARFQRWDSAISAYSTVAARAQQSIGVGTYSSQRAADARLELALIEWLFRDNPDAGRRHFRQFQDDFEEHRLSQSVAWHLVQWERLHGSDLDYRRALSAFADDYPDSQRVARAHQRREEQP